MCCSAILGGYLELPASLPNMDLVPVLLIKFQTLLRDVKECSIDSRYSNAIAHDFHELALMKMVKMPKISLQMETQGLDFAEG